MNQEFILQSFVILKSLRDNIKKEDQYTHEKYVEEYHKILDELKNGGHSLERFEISGDELEYLPSSYSPGTGTKYHSYRSVETQMLLTKLDAVLLFFQILNERPEQTIGFLQ